jgi:hypothetical protein
MELQLVTGHEPLLGHRAAAVDEHAAELDRLAPRSFVGMAKPRHVKREHA